MGQKIRIGTRESVLAVAQAELLKQYIEESHPEYEVTLVKMKTTGDRILDRKLEEIGGKGLFVKELDQALYEGRTDLSVHSLKDLPMETPEDFPILGYSRRESPEDVLVLPAGYQGTEPDLRRPIGTSSPRRRVQLEALYPGCRIKSVRGNVLTRLRKLDDGEYGALVLAAAGLLRLGLAYRISRWFSVTELAPAAGQGILAVQGGKDFDKSLLEGFFDADAGWQALAERSFIRTFGGGCTAPAAAYAGVEGDRLTLTGLLAGKDGSVHRAVLTAPKHKAKEVGEELARRVMASLPGNEKDNGSDIYVYFD